jgi:hypothetical protein
VDDPDAHVSAMAARSICRHQSAHAARNQARPPSTQSREELAMTASTQRVAIALVCIVGLFGLREASAQRGQGGGGGPMYDTKTEATFTGTVDAVENVTPPGCCGRQSLGGTHLKFKSGNELLEVHLGPTAFLQEQQAVFAKGDALDIVGSRVVIDNEPVVLAKEIKKSGRTWTLRDASGRPLWAGGRGRQ